MLIYLFKATAIWALLLALYELLYHNRPAFTLNRLYLLSGLCAGVLLPLLPLTLPETTAGGEGNVLNNGLAGLQPAAAAAIPAVQPTASGIDWMAAAGWLYLVVASVLLLASLRGLVAILRTAIYGRFEQLEGYRVFHSSRQVHAPFSFMGWIFIAAPEQYTEQELLFVLKHEDIHNRRRHWLDVLLAQLFVIVFWFHPLVWRYRHCLKLVHEYEADRLTAGDNAYDYGHFLLRQTLLKGVPSIAHSFHFSPIKNRIAMLTQPRKKQAWKYALWIPALFAGLLLAARPAAHDERVRVGDVTRYKGHDFYWAKTQIDSTMVQDPTTNEMTWVVTRRSSEIYKMDQDSVITNNWPALVPARFKDAPNFYTYIGEKFRQQYPRLPDSISFIYVNNVVIDEQGRIRYYDLECFASKSYDMTAEGSPFKAYAAALSKIIDESGSWVPAQFKGASGRRIAVQLQDENIYEKKR